jgi:hypothetical protein
MVFCHECVINKSNSCKFARELLESYTLKLYNF